MNIISNIQSISIGMALTWVGVFFFIISTVYIVDGLRRLVQIEKDILETQYKLDTIGAFNKRYMMPNVTDPNLEADKQIIQAELNKLNHQRQFILDKLPFLSLFKR